MLAQDKESAQLRLWVRLLLVADLVLLAVVLVYLQALGLGLVELLV
jgi:hypothetical protein